LAGKLGSRGRLNAVVPGSLVHIVDQLSGRRYLVDTGASFSIFPHKSSTPPSGQKLTGPDGQLIPCWGEKRIVLVFHGRRFAWTFLLADVQFPIIGVDFLVSLLCTLVSLLCTLVSLLCTLVGEGSSSPPLLINSPRGT
jgi:hypothetical protein